MRQDAYEPPHQDAGIITGIVLRRLRPDAQEAGERLMREIIAVSRTFDGYLGSDIYPPVPGIQDGYVIIYRYESSQLLSAWLDSTERQDFLKQLAPLESCERVEFHFASRRQRAGTVSTVLAYRVREESEEAFSAWRHRIYQEVRQQPGFLGTESFHSLERGEPYFIAVLRFDSREHLKAWMTSDTRRAYMREVENYVTRAEVRRTGTGFEGWFDYEPDPLPPPARWKQWLMILGVLYPVIMILKAVLAPVFSSLPFPAAFLILLMVDVAVLTYFIMPQVSRLLDFWLRPKPGATWRTALAGPAILIALIVATLVIELSL